MISDSPFIPDLFSKVDLFSELFSWSKGPLNSLHMAQHRGSQRGDFTALISKLFMY